MNIEKNMNKSDIFKSEFEQKIKPYIIKKLNDDETKVTISENYINELLNVNYTTDNLYIKMRNMLIGTNLGVSIKRKNKEFIFYKTLDGINRESDLFKKTFDNKLKPYLLEELKNICTIGFEETYLKEYLEVSYGSTNIYNNLKKMLSNTSISVSIRRNTVIKGKKINEFIFCNNELRKQIEEKNREMIENEKRRKKEITENIIKENKKLVDKVNVDVNNVLKNLPKVTDINEIEISDIGVPEFNCPKCNNKIKYHEEKCFVCNEQLIWQ